MRMQDMYSYMVRIQKEIPDLHCAERTCREALFELKTAGINRLWGNAKFSEQISSEKNNQFELAIKQFKKTSKQYWLYE
mgnify:CR=1 FL=1